jgi:type I restriction enzyme S subunit
VSTAKESTRNAGAGRFKPYPAYKDSGVEWLGEIPAHWEVKRLKYVASARISKLDVKPDDAVYVGLEHVEPWTGRLLLENQPGTVDSVVGSFRAGDVLFGKLRPYLAKVARPDFDGVCTSEILPLRPVPGCSQSYVMYELLNAPYIHWLDSLTYGTKMPRVSPEQVASSFVGLPPLPEQRAIAAFLDRETARIDALVAKKERLIALLEEQRTALITRAVTKGLDPTVPMKDSGVEWLGEIPAHWVSLGLSRVTLSRCDGPFGSGLKSEHYSGSGVRVIRLQNIGWTDFLDADEAYLDDAYARQLGDHSVVAGDLLIAGLGDEAHPVGRACVAPDQIEPAMVKADCFRFRLDRRRVHPRFAAYQLSVTASAAAGSLSTGATRARMNLTTTASRKVGLPPLDEQRAIVEALDRDGKRYRALVAKVREAIERLKELRTALISAAVTGKIDVREEAE